MSSPLHGQKAPRTRRRKERRGNQNLGEKAKDKKKKTLDTPAKLPVRSDKLFGQVG
ncbi:MAG: hypothetical protein HON76_19125 [Candidatus Scalindua sp.]|jgi:hypothetical protein|nr:hypothetical protein [Candidatus Scalindua sp.]MBT5306384.1 hypothetical protein [Candidatus Scalindua sp.]MBT6050012.1 hypothetical protein [Candidatus Scalindua sp.]MBT6230639.1 hypothetical protein [Candidatus Scalindua sp.]MBT6564633.1 hypothetical protein [Candidatus Scalindua sp.]